MFNSKIYSKTTKYLNNFYWTILIECYKLKWTIQIRYYNLKWTLLILYYNLKWTLFTKFKILNLLLKKRFKYLKKTTKKRFNTLKWNIQTTFRTLKWNIQTIFKFLYYKIILLYNKINIILYNIRFNLLIEVQLNTRWWVKIIYIDIFLITTVLIYFIFVIALPMWNAAAHLPALHISDPQKVGYIVTPNFIPAPGTDMQNPAIKAAICENILEYVRDPRRSEDKLLKLFGTQVTNYVNDDRFFRISIYSERWRGQNQNNNNFLHPQYCQELAHRVKISEHAHLYDFVKDERGIERLYPKNTPGYLARADFYILDALVKNPITPSRSQN